MFAPAQPQHGERARPDEAPFDDEKRKLMRALFDFALKRCIGILQLGSHAIELITKRFELVIGFDRYSLTEITTADSRSAIA